MNYWVWTFIFFANLYLLIGIGVAVYCASFLVAHFNEARRSGDKLGWRAYAGFLSLSGTAGMLWPYSLWFWWRHREREQ